MQVYLISLSTSHNHPKCPIKNITSNKLIEGDLLVPTDILNPTIEFDISDMQFSPFLYNYAIIVEFGRAYFIENFEFISNDFIRISFKVDVLATYYNAWREKRGLIARNESTYNDALNDDNMLYEQESEISYITLTMTSGVTLDTIELSSYQNENQNCVLNIVCDKIVNNYGFSYQDGYLVRHSEYNDIIPSETTQSMQIASPNCVGGFKNTYYYNLDKSNLMKFVRQTYNNTNLNTYIKSITLYPFSKKTSDMFTPSGFTDSSTFNSGYLYLGGTHIDLSPSTIDWQKTSGIIYVIADFTFTIDNPSYCDLSPNSKYYLWIPFYDYVELNVGEVLGKRLIVYYVCNFENATEQVYLYNVTDSKVIFSQQVNVSMTYGITFTNELEWRNNKQAIKTTSAIQQVSGALSLVGGLYGGRGLLSSADNIASIVGTHLKEQNQLAQNYHQATLNVSEGSYGMLSPTQCYIKKVSSVPLLYNNPHYAHSYGRPLYEYNYLRLLSGFTQVETIDLGQTLTSGNSSLINMPSTSNITDAELNSLMEILKSGFYMTI